MAFRRSTTLVVYLAPTEDDDRVSLHDYKTPQDFRDAFKSEVDRPPKWKLTYETESPPELQPKSGDLITGFHYLLTYSSENYFPHQHLRDIAAGKASQEPPSAKAWDEMKMGFSFMKMGCKNLYYLGADEEEPSERPEDEGRDEPIPSVETDEDGNLYTS